METFISQFDEAAADLQGILVRIKADSGWPTGTTQSGDIGARRELVSRSKDGRIWYEAERKQIRWLDGRRMWIALGLY